MSAEAIYCQVLPVADHRLLVAHGVVLEVLPLPDTTLSAAGAPRTVRWRGRELPLLSFERLSGHPAPDANPRTRVAILRLPGPTGGPVHAGLMIQGYPQMVPVEKDQLEAVPLTAADHGAPVLFRVRFARGEMLIPDLGALARELDRSREADAFLSQVAPAGLQDADGDERRGLGAQDAGTEPDTLEALVPGEALFLAVEPAFGADEEGG